MIYFLGIDFGKKGGISLLDLSGNILLKAPMPIHKDTKEVDVYEVEAIFAKVNAIRSTGELLQPLHVYGEKLHAIFGSSAKGTFNFGDDYGLVRGTAMVRFGHCNLIRAVDWQKDTWKHLEIEEIKKSTGKGKDTKAMALKAANKLWPKENWLATARSKKPHDGVIDSALIAEYARRNYE